MSDWLGFIGVGLLVAGGALMNAPKAPAEPPPPAPVVVAEAPPPSAVNDPTKAPGEGAPQGG